MVAATGMSPEVLERVLDPLSLPLERVGVNFLVPFLERDAVRVAAERARLVDFFWGEPDAALVEEVHAFGALACWQVGSAAEAGAAVEAGCDVGAGRCRGSRRRRPTSTRPARSRQWRSTPGSRSAPCAAAKPRPRSCASYSLGRSGTRDADHSWSASSSVCRRRPCGVRTYSTRG